MQKLLTVSIAAYNVENYLEEALNSFLIKELEDKLEVLIVNDGSTDGTSNIANRYVDKYPHIFKHINKKNAGWGSTINEGIRYATGKYFKQLDGDDFFEKEGLINLLKTLEVSKSDLIVTKFITFKDGSNEILDEFIFNKNLQTQVEYQFEDAICNIHNLGMHNITIKTKILKDHYEELKLTENCFYTDVEYLLKISTKIKTIIILPTSVYWYRIGRDGQSVSIDGICKYYKHHLTVLKNLLEYMNEKKLQPNIRSFFIDRLTDMASAQYERYLCLPISKENKRELIEYHKWIKNKYTFININRWKKIKLLIKTNFILYPFISKYTKNQIANLYK